MTDPQPTPTILDHAREAIRLNSLYWMRQWNKLQDHACEHYAEIAAALIAAHERIEAQTTTKCLLLEELAAMMAERKELETQRATELETAYREGFTDGDCYQRLVTSPPTRGGRLPRLAPIKYQGQPRPAR
jgi:hypothetical protein